MLLSYGAYLPSGRLDRAEVGATLGTGAGRGQRVVASFDEDSTTMGVAAARAALGHAARACAPADLYFATTSPAYLDKTNAAAIHTALGLRWRRGSRPIWPARPGRGWRRWSARPGWAGSRCWPTCGPGSPGSADERGGGDARGGVRVRCTATARSPASSAGLSRTAEVLDRWRAPEQASAQVWEERFGYEQYAPLIRHRGGGAGRRRPGAGRPRGAGLAQQRRGQAREVAGHRGPSRPAFSPVGHAGAADAGVALAAVLDHGRAGPDDPGAVAPPTAATRWCCAPPGCSRPGASRWPVDAQLKAGAPVPYATLPDLARAAGPRATAAARAGPPGRPAERASRGVEVQLLRITAAPSAASCICRPPGCATAAARSIRWTQTRLADTTGTVATFTVDRLAFSPSPPLVDAVVDFDGGGRYALEVADADPDRLAVGSRVELVFRRLFTAGGVHNYFWKARVVLMSSHGIADRVAIVGDGVHPVRGALGQVGRGPADRRGDRVPGLGAGARPGRRRRLLARHAGLRAVRADPEQAAGHRTTSRSPGSRTTAPAARSRSATPATRWPPAPTTW